MKPQPPNFSPVPPPPAFKPSVDCNFKQISHDNLKQTIFYPLNLHDPAPNTKHATHVSFDQRCYTLKHSAPFQSAGGAVLPALCRRLPKAAAAGADTQFSIYFLLPSAPNR